MIPELFGWITSDVVSRKDLKMKEFITLLPEVMVLVLLAAIFVVLLVTILKILRQVAFFQGKTAVVVALSVSTLCIVGLAQLLTVPGGTYNAAEVGRKTNGGVSYLLLAYVALAIAAAVILSQVLLLASRISPNEKPESEARKSEHPLMVAKPRGRPKKEEADLPPAKPKPHGRPKKEKLAEEQLKKEELKLPATHPESA
jgi:hypothetical protein